MLRQIYRVLEKVQQSSNEERRGKEGSEGEKGTI